MKPTTKRILIAGAIAYVVTLVVGTPEVITELIIFVPSFVVAFGLLCLVPKKTGSKR